MMLIKDSRPTVISNDLEENGITGLFIRDKSKGEIRKNYVIWLHSEKKSHKIININLHIIKLIFIDNKISPIKNGLFYSFLFKIDQIK